MKPIIPAVLHMPKQDGFSNFAVWLRGVSRRRPLPVGTGLSGTSDCSTGERLGKFCHDSVIAWKSFLPLSPSLDIYNDVKNYQELAQSLLKALGMTPCSIRKLVWMWGIEGSVSVFPWEWGIHLPQAASDTSSQVSANAKQEEQLRPCCCLGRSWKAPRCFQSISVPLGVIKLWFLFLSMPPKKNPFQNALFPLTTSSFVKCLNFGIPWEDEKHHNLWREMVISSCISPSKQLSPAS